MVVQKDVIAVKGASVDLEKIPRGSVASQQLEAYRSYGEKTALVDFITGQSLTYSRLSLEIRAVYQWMRQHGASHVKAGDNVVICARNILQYPVVLNATLLAGGTALLLPPDWRAADILHEVKEANPTLLIVDSRVYHKIREILMKMPTKPAVMFIQDDFHRDELHDGWQVLDNEERRENRVAITYSEITRHIGPEIENLAIPAISIDDQQTTAVIAYTAGTTAKPKAVRMSHLAFNGPCLLPTSRLFQLLSPSRVSLASMPFSNLFALRTLLLQPLLMGKEVHILQAPYYDIDQLAYAVQKEKITHLFLASDMITELMHHPATLRYDLNSVHTVVCANSERPSALRALCVMFKSLNQIYECYSSVETGIVAVASITGAHLATAAQEQRSVGHLEPSYEVKVINLRDGNELGPEDRGELCIRSPFLMNDYYPDDIISEQGFDEHGWYHTGDYGFYTGERILYRLARLPELIRAKEGFIVPSELEQIILEHPQVRDVTVVAVNDKITGLEVPRAYITPHQGVNLAPEDMLKCERDIVDYVEDRAPTPVMQLKGGVRIAMRLPRSSRDFSSSPGKRTIMHAK